MPTYTYRRDDGSTFEARQRITADPLEECPETGQPVERIFTRSPGSLPGRAPTIGPSSRRPRTVGRAAGLSAASSPHTLPFVSTHLPHPWP